MLHSTQGTPLADSYANGTHRDAELSKDGNSLTVTTWSKEEGGGQARIGMRVTVENNDERRGCLTSSTQTMTNTSMYNKLMSSNTTVKVVCTAKIVDGGKVVPTDSREVTTKVQDLPKAVCRDLRVLTFDAQQTAGKPLRMVNYGDNGRRPQWTPEYALASKGEPFTDNLCIEGSEAGNTYWNAMSGTPASATMRMLEIESGNG